MPMALMGPITATGALNAVSIVSIGNLVSEN